MITRILTATLMFVGIGFAQLPTPPVPHMGPGAMDQGPVFRVFAEGHRQGGAPEWWKNPDLAQKIGLTDAQVQKLNQIAFDHRMKMIDLRAALEREQLKLEPLMEASTPDENQILAQIDKVATQRAQVQKAQVQMTLATRRVLTPDQWKKLDSAHVRTMRHEEGSGENRMFFRQELRHAPGVRHEGPETAAPEKPE